MDMATAVPKRFPDDWFTEEARAVRSGYAAELVSETSANWHVLLTMPGEERVAAAHLAGRRFGIYLPEIDAREIVRGRVVDRCHLMFAGYVFVFMWGRQWGRVMACPGVQGILCINDRPVVMTDADMRRIQVIENEQRPLVLSAGEIAKPKKRRWRKSRRPEAEVAAEIGNEVVSVRCYSAFRDGPAS